MGDTNEKPLVITKSSSEKSAVSSKKSSMGKIKKSTEKISPRSSEEKLEKLHERLQSEGESKSDIEIKQKCSAESRKIEKVERDIEKKKSETLGKKLSKTKAANSKEKIFEKAHLDNRGSSQPSGINRPKTSKIIRNQSDIFSLKKETEMATSIFSVNGSPSRKVYRKTADSFNRKDDPFAEEQKPQTTKPKITRENYNDEKRPSSSYRNPLTGSGLTSNDEYKSKGCTRKDGNPLLGLGYDSEIVASQVSPQRVPPGGYSHRLW